MTTPERVPAVPLRVLGAAVLWAYAGGLAAAVLIAVVALAALLVLGLTWFITRTTDVEAGVRTVVEAGGWLLGPIVTGGAIWAGTYASTRSGSWPRTLTGTIGAVAVGVALLLLGSSAFLAAGLALGWAIALPARRAGRVAARGLPLVLAGLAAPRLDDLATFTVVALLMASPLMAAAVVGGADRLWVAVATRRASLSGE